MKKATIFKIINSLDTGLAAQFGLDYAIEFAVSEYKRKTDEIDPLQSEAVCAEVREWLLS